MPHTELRKFHALPDADEINTFFNEMYSHLFADKFMLDMDIATPEKKQAYGILMSKNPNLIQGMTRMAATTHFLNAMINDFVKELNAKKSIPKKLAFSISDSKLFAWAEISNDDEKTENDLFLAEALVNGKYYQYGVSVSTTVVEETDKIEIPNQYFILSMPTNPAPSKNILRR